VTAATGASAVADLVLVVLLFAGSAAVTEHSGAAISTASNEQSINRVPEQKFFVFDKRFI
jgi:hypothetical protein